MEKKIIALFVLTALLLMGCGQQQASSDTVKVGTILPLTGDASSYGIPAQKTLQLAVEEINNAGGINGKTLEIIYEDGQCTAKGGANAANKLINIDKVDVIIGGFCSGETLGAAPVAEPSGVILFSPGSGSPDITNAGDYIFRNFPSDATSGKRVAQAMMEGEHETVGIISENTDYAQALKNVFEETYTSLGGEVLAEETFNSDSSDFRTQILKIKENNPDAVYVVPQTPIKLGLVLKQMDEMGVTKPLYSNEFLTATEVQDNYGQYIEGGIFAEPEFNAESPKAQAFFQKYEDKYQEETGGSLPLVYYATTYDAVHIIKEAIAEVGYDSDEIKEYLYSIEGRVGTAGSLTIDENGDPEIEYILKKVENGTVVDA